MLINKLQLNREERLTFRLHTAYSAIEGIILGVIVLNEFVYLKSMMGSNFGMGFLFQFSTIVFLFLFFFNEFLKRTKNRKKLLRRVGELTRAPLLLLIIFPRSEEAVMGNSWFHLLFL